MKCRYFCRLPLDISPVYLTRGISNENQPAVFIDVPLFLCYDNGCMIMNRRKGHFLWEKHQKINQLNIKNIYASASSPMWMRERRR